MFLFLPSSCYCDSLRPITPADIKDVKEIISKMSLEEKLGQMFIIGFDKVRLPNDINELILKYNIGGVVYYQYNIPNQRSTDGDMTDNNFSRSVADLSNSLQLIVCNKSGSKIPLFISLDQENGATRVIERGITPFPNNISFGNARNKKLTREAGKIVGSELKAIGINMDFAPVVDVNTNNRNDIIGPRAFGGNKELVTALGVEFMKGLQEGGVLSVGKHYPGHGDTSGDPRNDKNIPRIENELDHIEQFMIPPFRALIDNGVDAIMTAHMIVPALGTQEGLPVSLSYDVINNLRTNYKFNGVVITDDITAMISITANYKVEDAARLALEAGNDIILLATTFPHTPSFTYNRFVSFFNKTIDDIRKSRIRLTENQINKSVERILLLKKRVNSDFNPSKWLVSIDDINNTLRKTSSLNIATDISNKSIVLVTEHGKAVSKIENSNFYVSAPLKRLPVSGENSNKILVVSSVYYPPDYLFDALKETGRHKFENIKLIYGFEKEPNSQDCINYWGSECSNMISEKARILVVKRIINKIYSPEINKDAPIIFSVVNNLHVDVLRKILNKVKDREFIVIGLRSPYLIEDDILSNKNVTLLCSGSGIETSIRSVVDALYGNLIPRPIDYISVSVGEYANRSIDIGANIDDGVAGNNEAHYKHISFETSEKSKLLYTILVVIIAMTINYYMIKFNWFITEDKIKYSYIILPLTFGIISYLLLTCEFTSTIINKLLNKYNLGDIVDIRSSIDIMIIFILATISTPCTKLVRLFLKRLFRDNDRSSG
jgi:beta-N-acetylhexosaminidase